MSDKVWLELAGQRVGKSDLLPDDAPGWMRYLLPDAQHIARQMIDTDRWPTLPAPVVAFHGVGPARSRPKWLLVVGDMNRPKDRPRTMARVSMSGVSPMSPRFYAGKKLLRVYVAWHLGQVRALQAQQEVAALNAGRTVERAMAASVPDIVAQMDTVLERWRPFLRPGTTSPEPVILPE